MNWKHLPYEFSYDVRDKSFGKCLSTFIASVKRKVFVTLTSIPTSATSYFLLGELEVPSCFASLCFASSLEGPLLPLYLEQNQWAFYSSDL